VSMALELCRIFVSALATTYYLQQRRHLPIEQRR